MKIRHLLLQSVSEAMKAAFGITVPENEFLLQKTRPEFKGDITLVIFPITKLVKSSPEQTGQQLGKYLKEHLTEVADFNVVKGFLNISFSDTFWLNTLSELPADSLLPTPPTPAGAPVMVEYSSPNTNKPLHLGHIRNNLIGHSLSEIFKATGYHVVKTNLVNDRGIHICKSMLAWEKWGSPPQSPSGGEDKSHQVNIIHKTKDFDTPESTGMKGDKLVGKYYVLFEKEFKKQVEEMEKNGTSKEEAMKTAPIIREAQELLRKWESGVKDVRMLWAEMNGWVYAGFEETYRKLGITFDKIYYESDTYLTGKEIVEKGLEKNVFFKEDDGSIWCDLTPDGLDKKLLQRADGTSVYITQDIGTAVQRYKEYKFGKHIYVVGNEQDYHFKVLFLVIKKLLQHKILPFSPSRSALAEQGGEDLGGVFYHLSYGMVDLPEGKMKSREGTVVDADDLIEEMVATARATTAALGKLENIPEEEKENIHKIIGIGALKYFILKVDPKKRMVFNPKESIDFEGNTGPFIQYTYARIQSLMRKSPVPLSPVETKFNVEILPEEKEVLKRAYEFPEIIRQAANEMNPAVIANYLYELAKQFNHFYQAIPVLKAETPELIGYRLSLVRLTGKVICRGMNLLGIEVPERM